MIPGSLDGAVILVVAVLPGAIYTWSFEREAGAFEVTLADRVLRFVAASAVLHLVLAPVLYLGWRVALEDRPAVELGQFVALWSAGALVLGVSATAGRVVGTLAINVSDQERRRRRQREVKDEADLRHAVAKRDASWPGPPTR